MNDADIQSLAPDAAPPRGAKKARLRARLRQNGLWSPNQMAGRRWSIGCVSLEITQRCNLDCTLCYLSDHSEAVRDIPMEEILRRIDMVYAHYGPGTDIQVSGGEPTLRARDELVEVVRYIGALGMRSSLFTNGIRATRGLLAELSAAGLTDVAFHVDTTQQRNGYRNEADLNALRDEYIDRARGLPIAVFFNTTVCDANLDAVPMLAAYFAARSDVVRTASFQLQAQTGRGVLAAHGEAVSSQGVIARIRQGVGAPLSFDSFAIGHPACNQYAAAFIVGGRAHDAFFDRQFAVEFMRRTTHAAIERNTRLAGAASFLRAALGSPRLALRAVGWVARLAWRAKRDLLRARGKVGKISFFLHNFMDARGLDPERLDSCVFMAATQHGPMSMCAYNARRDAFLLQPLGTGAGDWDPLAGRRRADTHAATAYPVKWLKGRARAAAVAATAAAMLAGCAVFVAVPPVEPASQPAALAAYARVLERFVDERGGVDFAALARDRRDLEVYVRHVADTPLGGIAERRERLAHLINSYNALSMYNVIESGIPATHAGLAKLAFFVNRKLTVGGEPISLREFENRIIRPLGEPRVHFALNCSAVSCPALPRKPFTAAGLEAELEHETRAFFARAENFRADDGERAVYLSEILRFYADDFVPGHAPSLVAYANSYAPHRAPDYAARFTPYDWTIANSRRNRR